MKNLFKILFLLLPLFFAACNDDGAERDDDDGEVATKMMDDDDAMATPESDVKIADFSNSPDFADASITSMTYKNGKFNFGVAGDNYKLGAQTPDAPQKMCANSDKGQHIHLILDKDPYIAKYESSFDQMVSDGDHYLLAFLSRSYHESIKNGKAQVAKKVMVKDGNITAENPITAPMLFYSRPKGDYIGKKATEKVMLDFFLVNATLGDDYKVKVDVNGEYLMTVDAWKPYFLEGLPMGDNKVKLTLVDGKGEMVANPLNPVERVFSLKEDPAEKG